jgi:hypothetical protein
MFDVLFIYTFPNVLNVCSLYLDNEQSEVPKCVAEDPSEQQPGEGKCPQTYHVLLLLLLYKNATRASTMTTAPPDSPRPRSGPGSPPSSRPRNPRSMLSMESR